MAVICLDLNDIVFFSRTNSVSGYGAIIKSRQSIRRSVSVVLQLLVKF